MFGFAVSATPSITVTLTMLNDWIEDNYALLFAFPAVSCLALLILFWKKFSGTVEREAGKKEEAEERNDLPRSHGEHGEKEEN